MKKYLAIASVLFTVACNNNADQKATENTDSTVATSNNNTSTTTESKFGSPEFLIGKYEITEYISENKKLDLKKQTTLEFFKDGKIIDNDGNNLFYKIAKDSVFIGREMNNLSPNGQSIKYLNAEKTSFSLSDDSRKSKITYKLISK